MNPSRGVVVPWFLPHVYGEEAPADSVLTARDDLTREGVDPAHVLATVPLPYSVVRTALPWLSQSCKTVLCRQMPLDQLIWWYADPALLLLLIMCTTCVWPQPGTQDSHSLWYFK